MGKKYTNFRVSLDGLEEREQWYALTTQWNYETYVVGRITAMSANLDNLITEAFTPTVEKTVVNLNSKKKCIKNIKENLLPSYVFIKTRLTIDVYKLLMNITGVYGFMCMGGVPSEITENDIRNIKDKMEEATITEVS